MPISTWCYGGIQIYISARDTGETPVGGRWRAGEEQIILLEKIEKWRKVFNVSIFMLSVAS